MVAALRRNKVRGVCCFRNGVASFDFDRETGVARRGRGGVFPGIAHFGPIEGMRPRQRCQV